MNLMINLAGGIALMLWGICMVRNGLTRAFGGMPSISAGKRPRDNGES